MTLYLLILLFMGFLLAICLVRTMKSTKPIASSLRGLLLAGVIPILSNWVLFATDSPLLAEWAYIVHFVGMDWMLFFLVRFAMDYCEYPFVHTPWEWLLGLIVSLDSAQLLVNPWLQHAFSISPATGPQLIPGSFYYLHIFLDYAMSAAVFIILLIKCIRVSSFVREKYAIILAALGGTILWETYNLCRELPLDKMMVGYAGCALIIYYFSMEYAPLVLRETMVSQVVSEHPDGLFFFDAAGTCMYANKKARELFGLRGDDFSDVPGMLSHLAGEDLAKRPEDGEVNASGRLPSGEYVLKISWKRLIDPEGKLGGSFVSVQDRTVEERNNARQRFLATHDDLTRCFEKKYLYKMAGELIREDADTLYCVVVSDVRGFKLINDLLGTATGDEILISISQTIGQFCTDHAVYGRLGNDKFGMVIRREDFDPERFMKELDNISYRNGPEYYPIIIHMGVYEAVDRSIPAALMFDRAILAIDAIKDDLEKRVAFYDSKLRSDLLWEQKIYRELDTAMEQGQIRPYLHAQVDGEGRMQGAEILARWIHPEEGFLPPARFIPVLEKNGTIARLDAFMWEEACRILKRWKEMGWPELYLSVNISPRDFYFVDVKRVIPELVEKYGIRPENLRLEITETVMMTDMDRRMKILAHLRALGFILEIDDFGSGYSSLNMLKDMPVDVLKIDMLFLQKSVHEQRAKIILKGILAMARDLELPVITEGVETKEQVEMLKENGCEHFQGFYFARPIGLEGFEANFMQRKPGP